MVALESTIISQTPSRGHGSSQMLKVSRAVMHCSVVSRVLNDSYESYPSPERAGAFSSEIKGITAIFHNSTNAPRLQDGIYDTLEPTPLAFPLAPIVCQAPWVCLGPIHALHPSCARSRRPRSSDHSSDRSSPTCVPGRR